MYELEQPEEVLRRSLVSTRSSPIGLHPSSPISHSENEGYNSSDEHMPSFVPSHSGSGLEREHQFETEIRQSKGFEIRRMLEDGNCLFRAVADQVYGDSESYDLTRQMCMDYMYLMVSRYGIGTREGSLFQFITEGFTFYLNRKRRDKVFGNNVKIQDLAEMYNRPIHIYSYSTEPINIFQGSYNTDTPHIRQRHVDGEQVKAAIKAQQEHQIDNKGDITLILSLRKRRLNGRAETSSSGARTSGFDLKPKEAVKEKTVLSSSVEMVLSMGFSYTQTMEAYSIFGDDVDSIVCYLLETSCSSNNRRKGKATQYSNMSCPYYVVI
ncbi:OTU-like cysteine protease family protein [Raphanus sativus]|nr:OTU-like cysteine protease family protein [Raphanus sativus]